MLLRVSYISEAYGVPTGGTEERTYDIDQKQRLFPVDRNLDSPLFSSFRELLFYKTLYAPASTVLSLAIRSHTGEVRQALDSTP